jgi:Uncharacterized protein conserved in bacteria
LALFLSVPQKGFAQTEFNWSSLTWDNDAFLGNDDDGYTNGMYIALYQLKEYEQPSNAPWLLRPLMWSLTEKADVGLNAYTIGQAMITPQNTETETPAEDDLPYSGLLFLNNSYLSIHQNYTDKISTTIGIVGPLSLAEESQKTIHKWIGSGEPKGWDTQLKNELVFQLSRARAYRSWVADNNCWDLITAGEVSIGTLSSGVNVDVVLRFGTALKYSYATHATKQHAHNEPYGYRRGRLCICRHQCRVIYSTRSLPMAIPLLIAGQWTTITKRSAPCWESHIPGVVIPSP